MVRLNIARYKNGD